jgi:hypothetical protein
MSHRIISTILRHDSKQTSYKIALLRALNDVVLAYPDAGRQGRDVAIPLRLLAERWVAYYWPFVNPMAPIQQGVVRRRHDRPRQDVGFRAALTELRRQWADVYGGSKSGDGWHVIEHLRASRHRRTYAPSLVRQYGVVLGSVMAALRMPIRYAGPGEWSVFAAPRTFSELAGVDAVPGTSPEDACLVVNVSLWEAFRDVSLWVEALCIHEWSLFTERVGGASRGEAYVLLTEREGNRLPVTWERNHIELLFLEGVRFTCPWTGRTLARDGFQLDHIVPVSIYPFHELWNLVPADSRYNMHGKRALLPGTKALESAVPRLTAVYDAYRSSPELGQALREDVASRFSRSEAEPEGVTRSVVDLVESIAAARNVARF